MTLYEITAEAVEIEELFENAVDENGEPRELTQEEKETLNKWILANEETFKEKFDGYGKLIENLLIQSQIAKATRDTLKGELDRLTKRAKTAENRVEQLKNSLLWAIKTMKIDSVKTALFSAKVGLSRGSVNTDEADPNKLPLEFIKKEVSKSAIQDALKSGKLTKTESGMILKNGEILEGLRFEQKETLTIR